MCIGKDGRLFFYCRPMFLNKFYFFVPRFFFSVIFTILLCTFQDCLNSIHHTHLIMTKIIKMKNEKHTHRKENDVGFLSSFFLWLFSYNSRMFERMVPCSIRRTSINFFFPSTLLVLGKLFLIQWECENEISRKIEIITLIQFAHRSFFSQSECGNLKFVILLDFFVFLHSNNAKNSSKW